jgi:two-component system, OmpR family, alkaline phosphatase synthesis response regulator PhoP
MNKTGHKILVVDDEVDILELLHYNLTREGYEVRTARDGAKAIEVAKEFLPNLIVLDIMMPFQDGVETCRRVREIAALKNTLVLFLTARSEEYSEVAAFEVGADDFITKPIKPRALVSRIQALLRRKLPPNADEGKLTLQDLVIDKSSYTVTKAGEIIPFPKKEFELLNFLASNPQKVFTREDLLNHIWGADVYVLARTVDVHVRKVREKIGENYILTIKGVGYKFDPYAKERV